MCSCRNAWYRMHKFLEAVHATVIIAVISAICITPGALPAATVLHADGVIGQLRQYQVRHNQSLIEIARQFDLGFNEIADANPGVDPFIPRAGSTITIPTAWIAPAVSTSTPIVVNIAELRLYFFPKSRSSTFATFPIGIGDEGRDTPIGNYTIIEKMQNPAWHVPKSIRVRSPDLPEVIPPGPTNPLGSYALRLSRRDILIHGTNRPWGIGRRSSHGCLRLYPEDIKQLFQIVHEGMRVAIVNQPVKVCASGKKVFVEVHRYGGKESSVGEAMQLLASKKLLGRTDFSKLIRAVKEKKGMPIEVTRTR